MALLEEQFTEKLDAGAPDITYEGNEGQETTNRSSALGQTPSTSAYAIWRFFTVF